MTDYSALTIDMLLGLEPIPASMDVIEGEILDERLALRSKA